MGCVFEQLSEPIRVDAPESDPLCATFKNCTFSAREGAEHNAFGAGKNLKSITLKGCKIKGFDSTAFLFDPKPETVIED